MHHPAGAGLHAAFIFAEADRGYAILERTRVRGGHVRNLSPNDLTALPYVAAQVGPGWEAVLNQLAILTASDGSTPTW